MLKNTFIHLSGIGRKKELALWQRGILTWDDLYSINSRQNSLFDDQNLDPLLAELDASRNAFDRGDTGFFAERLPTSDLYRIALTYPDQTAFLDIETTGLSHFYDEITLVGVGLGEDFFFDLQGTEKRKALDALQDAKCVVTFNGSLFDLKFLSKKIDGFSRPQAHVDLRYFARRFGLSGGQKSIEKQINVRREVELEGVVGETAPILWHEYRHGSVDAAKTLIKYNYADIDGMRFIFEHLLREVSKSNSLLGDFFPKAPFAKEQKKISWVELEKQEEGNCYFVPPFSGKFGSQVTYEDLIASEASCRDLRVVGIDLTGSEKRATGWALLDGNSVTTELLSTDEKLVTETLRSKPHVVSIDSPLSMPKGRTRVTDDDPVRDEFGIMRQCERELKRRGVNVYPSLLPSMQALTGRGMRLADRFRAEGIPVIESYPGAAQDIMGIPRKQAGLHFLKKGLADFGVIGNFLTRDVSHDEVDAVTSAIVGLFFWSGKFEALGIPEEEYLIIPDLRVQSDEWTSRRVVGISGAIASGKTTAARALEGEQFEYARYSQALAKLLTEEGKEINRGTLQEIGLWVNSEHGQRWLGRKLLDSVNSTRLLVIDGIRHPEDHAFLVETYPNVYPLVKLP